MTRVKYERVGSEELDGRVRISATGELAFLWIDGDGEERLYKALGVYDYGDNLLARREATEGGRWGIAAAFARIPHFVEGIDEVTP